MQLLHLQVMLGGFVFRHRYDVILTCFTLCLQVVRAALSMVDLAGSERVRKTQSSGVLLREASYINKSLTFLEQVAIAILEGREHVPYRCDAPKARLFKMGRNMNRKSLSCHCTPSLETHQ